MSRSIRIGVLGDGDVAQSLTAMIAKGPSPAGTVVRVDSAEVVGNTLDVDVIVDTTATVEPAYAVAGAALAGGTPVVTANRALVSRFGRELQLSAHEQGVGFRYGSAPRGGWPITEGVARGFTRSRLLRIEAVLDSSVTRVADLMTERGATFDEARSRIYGTDGIDGDLGLSGDLGAAASRDAIAILASAGFQVDFSPDDVVGRQLENIEQSDIDHLQQFGYVLRLVCTAIQTGGALGVAVLPTLLPGGHPMASLRGAVHRIVFRAAGYGPVVVDSPAEAAAVAATILDDIDAVLGEGSPPSPPLRRMDRLVDESIMTAAYFRILTSNPGQGETLVTDLLNETGISLELASPRRVPGGYELVFITGPSSVAALDGCRAGIAGLDIVDALPTFLYVASDPDNDNDTYDGEFRCTAAKVSGVSGPTS